MLLKLVAEEKVEEVQLLSLLAVVVVADVKQSMSVVVVPYQLYMVSNNDDLGVVVNDVQIEDLLLLLLLNHMEQ